MCSSKYLLIKSCNVCYFITSTNKYIIICLIFVDNAHSEVIVNLIQRFSIINFKNRSVNSRSILFVGILIDDKCVELKSNDK